MAFIQRSGTKVLTLSKTAVRFYSKTERTVKKSVFISQSRDIYSNLALEEWLYRNFDFTNHHVLMLWQNSPCMVIGKNQNPWTEGNYCELPNISEDGVQLARKSSNGEALYHDPGNLNLTFFAPKERCDVDNNLKVISRGLFREFGLTTDLGSNELLLRKNKHVTRSSVKLGGTNSYHQCSLLIASNKVNLNMALQRHDVSIKSNTSLTMNPKFMNLCEENPNISIPTVLKAIGWEFLRTTALSMKDGGSELANQQKGFQMVNPTESWFPGLQKIREHYSSWEWCYGTTPKFSISRTFMVPEDLINNRGTSGDLKVTMAVENGKISDITLFVPEGFSTLGFSGEAKVITNLKGKKFSVEAFDDLEDSFGFLLDEKQRFVTECLKQVMTCA